MLAGAESLYGRGLASPLQEHNEGVMKGYETLEQTDVRKGELKEGAGGGPQEKCSQLRSNLVQDLESECYGFRTYLRPIPKDSCENQHRQTLEVGVGSSFARTAPHQCGFQREGRYLASLAGSDPALPARLSPRLATAQPMRSRCT